MSLRENCWVLVVFELCRPRLTPNVIGGLTPCLVYCLISASVILEFSCCCCCCCCYCCYCRDLFWLVRLLFLKLLFFPSCETVEKKLRINVSLELESCEVVLSEIKIVFCSGTSSFQLISRRRQNRSTFPLAVGLFGCIPQWKTWRGTWGKIGRLRGLRTQRTALPNLGHGFAP